MTGYFKTVSSIESEATQLLRDLVAAEDVTFCTEGAWARRREMWGKVRRFVEALPLTVPVEVTAVDDMPPKHPLQPLVYEMAAVRFKRNMLVCYLYHRLPRGMNELAALVGVPDEDRQQLAQLIGYSLSGYAELPYVDKHSLAVAQALPKPKRRK